MAKNNFEKTPKEFILIIGGILLLVFLLAALVIALLSFPFGNETPSGIAIIPLKGEISNSSGAFDSTLGSDEIVELIEEAEKNPQVGAIFLDIDSPGGEVVASKQIVYKVRSSKKPVYSYINSLGTSGAYYIASASDYIMADEDSITGSIGVISIFYNLQELLDNIGVEVTVVKEGNLKAIGSPFKELTDEEREIIQGILAEVYEGFKNDVLEFRAGKITKSELEKIADGRIISGRQALKANLVDELLTKEQAFEKAAELAGIKNPEKIPYGAKEISLADLFFSAGKDFGLGLSSSLKVNSNIQIK